MANNYYNFGSPVVPGTRIVSARYNQDLSGVAAAFDLLPDSDDLFLSLIGYGPASGTTPNVYNVTIPVGAPLVGYVVGMQVTFLADKTSTGAAQVNVNGLGNKTIVSSGTVGLPAGSIIAGSYYTMRYDGTNFQMQTALYALFDQGVQQALAAAAAALVSQNAAAASATTASNRAAAALVSQNAAAGSATAAGNSATSAASSASLALQYRDEARAARDTAVGYRDAAAASATSASGSATTATNQATTATNRAAAALVSQNAAAASATAAANSAALAQQYQPNTALQIMPGGLNDINAIQYPGIYIVNQGATGQPVNAPGTLTHILQGSDYWTQEFTSGTAGTNRKFIRLGRGQPYTAVNWGGWAELYSTVQQPDLSSLPGVLPITSGGTGNTTGRAASATVLATARALDVNLAANSGATVTFDGSANRTLGVSGVLSTSNGGTGATSAAGAWANIAQYGNTANTAARGSDNRLARAWATVNGSTSTLAAAQGVSSVTKNSVGDWTVNFSPTYADNTYSFTLAIFTTGNAMTAYGFTTKTANVVRVRCVNVADGTLVDPSQFMIQIFGS